MKTRISTFVSNLGTFLACSGLSLAFMAMARLHIDSLGARAITFSFPWFILVMGSLACNMSGLILNFVSAWLRRDRIGVATPMRSKEGQH